MDNYSIDIQNLTIRFGEHIALDNINIKIKDGDFISIIGPNGGGKSTLLKVILNLIEPSQGKVIILANNNNKNIQSSEIGYVPQIKTLDRSFPCLPEDLVLTGVISRWAGLFQKTARDKARDMLKKVGAIHTLNTPLRKLSGGELQRVYLARALVRKPKILLLDEPSAGIDSPGESDISKIIEEYQNETNATIIMVTHDWEQAYHHSDWVVMLNREVVCYQKPAEAFNEQNMRRTFGHIGHKHEMIFGVSNA